MMTTYAVETLYTDTITYDVIRRTAQTITVRERRATKEIANVNNPGEPYPCNDYVTESNPDAPTKVVRLRKDGTYRTGPGRNPLRFTTQAPTERVDYRV